MSVSYFPVPSTVLGAGGGVVGGRQGERSRGRTTCAGRGRVRRVAFYGPLAITYDCEVSAVDGETGRDVLEVAFVPDDWSDGWPKVRNADGLLRQALGVLQSALNISADELIENAPKREAADGGD